MKPLSEELWLQKFSYLQPTLDEAFWWTKPSPTRVLYSALSSLCLTSKTFRRVATPLLYHSIIVYTPLGSRKDTTDPKGASNARMLLRTCLENSSLASHIKQMQVEDLKGYTTHTTIEGFMARMRFNQLFRTYDLQVPQEMKSSLQQLVGYGFCDVEVTILLLLCENLEFLDMVVETNIMQEPLHVCNTIHDLEPSVWTSYQAFEAPYRADSATRGQRFPPDTFARLDRNDAVALPSGFASSHIPRHTL